MPLRLSAEAEGLPVVSDDTFGNLEVLECDFHRVNSSGVYLAESDLRVVSMEAAWLAAASRVGKRLRARYLSPMSILKIYFSSVSPSGDRSMPTMGAVRSSVLQTA